MNMVLSLDTLRFIEIYELINVYSAFRAVLYSHMMLGGALAVPEPVNLNGIMDESSRHIFEMVYVLCSDILCCALPMSSTLLLAAVKVQDKSGVGV